MKHFILITVFILLACNSLPKENQYYEHKGTRDRIMIKYAGQGRSAYNYCKYLTNEFNGVYTKTRGYEPFHIKYSESDSLNDCIVFSQEGDFTKTYFQTYYNIISIEQLKIDYKPVE